MLFTLMRASFQEVSMKFHRIKDLREDNDKYQKDIAELLGISQQYYSEYEQGNHLSQILSYFY